MLDFHTHCLFINLCQNAHDKLSRTIALDIEINVTSPTGIQEINRLSGTKIEADIWDAIEKRFAASR